MKVKFALVALFIVFYSIFVIVLMPAQWLVNQITLPKNITLSQVKGSIWQTNIDALVIDGIKINDIKSKLRVTSLLTLDPTFDIQFGNKRTTQPQGTFQLNGLFSNIAISQAQVNIPANFVVSRLDFAVDIQAHNHFDLKVEHYQLGKPLCSDLMGQLQWKKAAITALDETVQLGLLAVDLTCDKGDVVATVEPKNNLGLNYTLNIKSAKQINGNGYLKPGVKFPAQLKEVLGFLGKPDKQGRYQLKM